MEWWLLAVAGLAAGYVSGLLGVGGGIVMTPTLHYVAGLEWAQAVALSLFVITVQAPVGIWRHRAAGAIDMRLAWPLILGGAAGVALGIWLLPRSPVVALKLLFAALMVFAAWRLGSTLEAETPRPPSAAAVAALGVGAGTVSRLLGVGGGILTVPALALAGTATHVAVASSLVAVWTNAAIATGVNVAGGLDVLIALPLLTAVLGAPLGVRSAHALPAERLRRVVAVALAATAVIIAVEAALAAKAG